MPWDLNKTSVRIDEGTPSERRSYRVQAARNPIIQFSGTGLIDTEGLEISTEYSINGEDWYSLETIALSAGAVIGAVSDLQDLSEDDTLTRAPYFRWTLRPVGGAVLDEGEFAQGTLSVAWWIDDITNDGAGVI